MWCGMVWCDGVDVVWCGVMGLMWCGVGRYRVIMRLDYQVALKVFIIKLIVLLVYHISSLTSNHQFSTPVPPEFLPSHHLLPISHSTTHHQSPPYSFDIHPSIYSLIHPSFITNSSIIHHQFIHHAIFHPGAL